MDTSKQPGIIIHQVFLLRAQLAHRDDVFAIPANTAIPVVPLSIDVNLSGKPGDKAVAIRLRVSTVDAPEAFYKFDVEIAAVIGAQEGEENLDPFEYASQMGAAAFYPFLREAVANLTMKGRFGPIWLRPVNFLAATQEIAVPAPAKP